MVSYMLSYDYEGLDFPNEMPTGYSAYLSKSTVPPVPWFRKKINMIEL